MGSLLLAMPPGTWMLVGACVAAVLPGRLRPAWVVAVPLLSWAHLVALPADHTLTASVLGMELTPVRVDRLSMVWGHVFHLAALLSAIYSAHVDDRIEQPAALVYAGTAIGAAFAGDLATLFTYWELTAVSSVFLIWARRTERSRRVGQRYLVIQVLSGVLVLFGAVAHVAETGSIAFSHLGIDHLGGVLIFVGFGIKAAFPLLHNWLQDAYPEATVTGTVWLSAFTTKLAIYALARGFAGVELLIPIGAVMTCFPVFYAVIENDLRRVLAYSLNNQLGFMVVGIGIGTELSLNGTAAHAFAHIVYKALLFMAMGAVLHRAGTIKASELGGLHKAMPLTAVLCIVGSLSISGFPLFSGFVTKSMILAAGAEQHLLALMLALWVASAGVVDHSGIKIPFFAFFAHDQRHKLGREVQEAPWNMLLAMGLAAAICVGIGLHPDPLYAILPYEVDYAPYTAGHVIESLQLLLFAALAFTAMQLWGLYPPELPAINLDTDWVYRKVLPALAVRGLRAARAVHRAVSAQTEQVVRVAISYLRHWHRPAGSVGEPWPTGTTAMWAAVVLGATILLASL